MWKFAVSATALAAALLTVAGGASAAEDGWIELFNGKDTTGWKLKNESYTVTKFVDEAGKDIPGAKKGKVDQKVVVANAKGILQNGARLVEKDGKKTYVDLFDKEIPGAKLVTIGGRDAIVDKAGEEIKGAKAVVETHKNETGGWKVVEGVLISGNAAHGTDIFTERKFTDFDLHVEFLATANSGVYLQGRYEIQIDNSVNVKPITKDGKTELPKGMCGALYSTVAPSKNMAKPPTEWQSFDISFRACRGKDGKVTEKAKISVVWNGEKVIDGAEIDRATGGALDGKVLEPGSIMLQGDHGKVSYRNIRIKPIN